MLLQRIDILLVGGWRINRIRIERWTENFSASRDQLEFLRLVSRDKAIERPGACNFRHFGEPGLDPLRFLLGLDHHVDGVRAGIGIFPQIQICGDRFDFRAP